MMIFFLFLPENTLEGVSIVALLLMKSLNKTETPIFWSVVCSLFPKSIFLTFICLFMEIVSDGNCRRQFPWHEMPKPIFWEKYLFSTKIRVHVFKDFKVPKHGERPFLSCILLVEGKTVIWDQILKSWNVASIPSCFKVVTGKESENSPSKIWTNISSQSCRNFAMKLFGQPNFTIIFQRSSRLSMSTALVRWILPARIIISSKPSELKFEYFPWS